MQQCMIELRPAILLGLHQYQRDDGCGKNFTTQLLSTLKNLAANIVPRRWHIQILSWLMPNFQFAFEALDMASGYAYQHRKLTASIYWWATGFERLVSSTTI